MRGCRSVPQVLSGGDAVRAAGEANPAAQPGGLSLRKKPSAGAASQTWGASLPCAKTRVPAPGLLGTVARLRLRVLKVGCRGNDDKRSVFRRPTSYRPAIEALRVEVQPFPGDSHQVGVGHCINEHRVDRQREHTRLSVFRRRRFRSRRGGVTRASELPHQPDRAARRRQRYVAVRSAVGEICLTLLCQSAALASMSERITVRSERRDIARYAWANSR
jgi:hypothetical protein